MSTPTTYEYMTNPWFAGSRLHHWYNYENGDDGDVKGKGLPSAMGWTAKDVHYLVCLTRKRQAEREAEFLRKPDVQAFVAVVQCVEGALREIRMIRQAQEKLEYEQWKEYIPGYKGKKK